MRVPPFQRRKAGIAALLGFALAGASLVAVAPAANAVSTGLVISEIYTAGSSPTYTNDFVELYNPTASAISVAGHSIQYRAASNVNTISSSQIFALSGSVPAGGRYLLTGTTTGGTGVLPPANATSTLNLSGGGGQVYLASTTTGLPATTAGSQVGAANVIDMIGYGTGVVFETTAAAAPTTPGAQSLSRTGADTDVNLADFSVGTPTPEAAPVVVEPEVPVPATIAEIQGTGSTSPLAGELVITRGVVTAAYPTGGYNGYYIQTAGSGGALDLAAHTASDGLFVFSGSTDHLVAVGDHVELTGRVSEYQGLTELTVTSAADLEILTEVAPAPVPVTSTLPFGDAREALEGMLVLPSGDFTVTDNYDLNAYGSFMLNPGTEPLRTPTEVVQPGAEAIAYAAQNAARALVVDDGSGVNYQNGASRDIPLPYLSPTSTIRIGSAATFTRPVVLDYRFSAWTLQPTAPLTVANAPTVQPVTVAETRPAGPADVGGDVALATFNVLNYFPTTGDQLVGCEYYTDRAGNPITVKDKCDARGAANAANLARQQAKIVSAINALGADVVSLEEIENSVRLGKARDFALSTLVDALNAAAGSTVWAYVPSPLVTPASQDVIRTAFIYKPAAVTPVGTSVIHDDPAAFSNARQPLAQKFQRTGGAASDSFIAIVNHFKSKSPSDTVPDPGDGAGAFNADRVKQAQSLVAFADAMKSSTATQRVFLTGDFNAYLQEDPIDVLRAAGYVDLGSTRTSKSTYAFDGAVGSLDHIFASASAVDDVNAVDIWNINAYESIAFEYSRYNYNATDFYAPGPYRSSDHDPIIVGVDLRSTISSNLPKIVGDAKVGATLRAKTGTWDPAPVTLSYRWLNNGEPIKGATKSTYKVKKSDKGDRISVRVTGKKPGYTTVVRTSASVKIYLALKVTPKPKITGTPKVGKTLSVKAGTWKPSKVALKYRWYRDGEPISGADDKSYRLTSADKGAKITIKVTGSKKGYFTESETRSIARIR